MGLPLRTHFTPKSSARDATSRSYRKHTFLQNVRGSSALPSPTRRTNPRSRRLLNQLPGLTYDTIKESVKAAVRIHPSLTPIELFHRYGYKTYFSPTSSTGFPEPSPIPESFVNPFRTIESSEQPHVGDYYNEERAEKTRPKVVNISEEEGSFSSGNNDIREEGSVDSGNNDIREEGYVDSGNNDIREEGSVDSRNNNHRGARENPAQSENTTPPPEQQESHQLHKEEQIKPKLPSDQPAIPKRVTFTPGPLDRR
jgi:hypothetical protein